MFFMMICFCRSTSSRTSYFTVLHPDLSQHGTCFLVLCQYLSIASLYAEPQNRYIHSQFHDRNTSLSSCSLSLTFRHQLRLPSPVLSFLFDFCASDDLHCWFPVFIFPVFSIDYYIFCWWNGCIFIYINLMNHFAYIQKSANTLWQRHF